MNENRREMDIPVLLLYGDGTSEETAARITVSDEEYELMRQCRREGRDIQCFAPLHSLCFRAVDCVTWSLSLYSANDNIMMPGGLENLQLRVCLPRELPERRQAGNKLGSKIER